MNEFTAVSAEQLDQVEGGIVPLIAIAGGALIVYGAYLIGTSGSGGGGGEVLPGFNNFLANTQRIAGKA
jgi:hypothetical protein